MRAVLCGQRRPPDERDWGPDFLALAELKPLGFDDIDAYIAKRIAGPGELSDEARQALATMVFGLTNGTPADRGGNRHLQEPRLVTIRGLVTEPTSDTLAAFRTCSRAPAARARTSGRSR